jgi:hypothetical protein
MYALLLRGVVAPLLLVSIATSAQCAISMSLPLLVARQEDGVIHWVAFLQSLLHTLEACSALRTPHLQQVLLDTHL